MPTEFNIQTLLSLLDDDDIWQQVANDLVNSGLPIVDELRSYCWANRSVLNEIQTERLEYVLQRINFKYTYRQFNGWVKKPQPDLLEAIKYVATYVYPTFDDSNNLIENKINHICDDVEVRLLLSMSMPDIIEQINEVLFNIYHFKIAEPEEVHNYSMGYLLSYKKGAASLFTLLYLLITQKLGLPVYPVYLEHHLILGALNRSTGSLTQKIAGSIIQKPAFYTGTLDFFIDPANNGAKFGKAVIADYLHNNNLPFEDRFFSPCTHHQAVYFLLLSFSMALHAKKDTSGSEEINKLLSIIEKYC